MTKTILKIKGSVHQADEFSINDDPWIAAEYEIRSSENQYIHNDSTIIESTKFEHLGKLAGELSALIDGLKYAAQHDLKDIQVKGSKPMLTLVRTGNAGVKKFDKDETYQTAIQAINTLIERMESRGFSIQA